MNKRAITTARWHKRRLVQMLSEYFDVSDLDKTLDTMIETLDWKRVATIVDKQKESYEDGYADGYNEANIRRTKGAKDDERSID